MAASKGRFAFSHLQAQDRVVDPLRKARSVRGAFVGRRLTRPGLIRGAEGRIVTVRPARRRSSSLRAREATPQGVGAHCALLPEPVVTPTTLPGTALTIRDAELVVVVGDEPVAERAPIVDLWIREARRNGAEIVRQSEGDSGSRTTARRRRAVLVVSGAERRALAVQAGSTRRCAASTSRERRTDAASPTPGPRPADARPRTRSRSACDRVR